MSETPQTISEADINLVLSGTQPEVASPCQLREAGDCPDQSIQLPHCRDCDSFGQDVSIVKAMIIALHPNHPELSHSFSAFRPTSERRAWEPYFIATGLTHLAARDSRNRVFQGTQYILEVDGDNTSARHAPGTIIFSASQCDR